jgi:cytochrome c oxidase subunit 4
MNSISHPKKIYLRVWVALLALLLLTWGVAEFDLGPFNSIVAIGISVIKMMLVLWFFMHLRNEPALTLVFAAAGLVWFLIMVDLTLSDYLTRGEVRGRNPVPLLLQPKPNPQRPIQ